MGSPFSRGFDLGRYDDDKREANIVDPAPIDLRDLLRSVSYYDQVVSELEKTGAHLTEGENCFVLLYDYIYQPVSIAEWAIEGLRLRYAGGAPYNA